MSFKQVIVMALASTALAQMTSMESQMDAATTTPDMSPSAPDSYVGVTATTPATMATEMDSAASSAAGYVTQTTMMPVESSAADTTSMMESSMSGTTSVPMESSMSGSATTMTTMAGGGMGSGGMGGSSPNATSSSQPVAGSGAMSGGVSAGLFIVSATFAALLLL